MLLGLNSVLPITYSRMNWLRNHRLDTCMPPICHPEAAICLKGTRGQGARLLGSYHQETLRDYLHQASLSALEWKRLPLSGSQPVHPAHSTADLFFINSGSLKEYGCGKEIDVRVAPRMVQPAIKSFWEDTHASGSTEDQVGSHCQIDSIMRFDAEVYARTQLPGLRQRQLWWLQNISDLQALLLESLEPDVFRLPAKRIKTNILYLTHPVSPVQQLLPWVRAFQVEWKSSLHNWEATVETWQDNISKNYKRRQWWLWIAFLSMNLFSSK